MCVHYYHVNAATVKALVAGLNRLFVDGKISDQQYFMQKERILDTLVAVSQRPVVANLFVV